MADLVVVPNFPNVPIAPGIPAMARPTAAINAILSGPAGLNATLANANAVHAIIGGLTNSGSLLSYVPGAQQLLSLPPAAQLLLYQVPGFSTVMKDVQTAQALFQTAQGLGSLLANVAPVQRLIAGPATNAATTAQQPWGIFDTSSPPQPVAVADSVLKVEFLKDWKIADYPIEPATAASAPTSFESYNKVETPFTVRVTLAKGGKLDAVNTFLSALQAAAATTNLYNVSTPQWVYQGVNISHLDWVQEATRGAYLLTTIVWLEQIRQLGTPSAPANNTQQPSAANPVGGGIAQPQPAPASVVLPNTAGFLNTLTGPLTLT